MQKLYESIDKLVDFAKKRLGLISKDVDYTRNTVLDILSLAFPPTHASAGDSSVAELLEEFVTCAVDERLFEKSEAERYCDAVMGALSLPPSVIQEKFEESLKDGGAKAATDMFYAYCVDNNYVKKAQLEKNPRFEIDGLIITINKSKPEFRDAKKAAAGNSVGGGYPSCTICHANEGFGGRQKRNLRTVDITLGGQKWFWQYSPYGYFNEHGIAVNYEHIPMHIDRETFTRLIDFVDTFPHYFIGCNAALPRIGGSVLAHDHYQGGREVLPLHTAKAAQTIVDKKTKAVFEILDWPGTVIRVVSAKREAVIDASERIRAAWDAFDAPELGIVRCDSEGMHNCISPTVVKTNRGYEMNIILRNNVTSKEYPDGVFHAHPEFHSVKKESIGLIEAQGLFILPGRLEGEVASLKTCIMRGEELPEELSAHKFIFEEILQKLGGSRSGMVIDEVVRAELGSVCRRILENTAVFKDRQQTADFIKKVL